MAENKVILELVSPERVLASEEVDMVTLPGAEGEFGVLPEHAPLVALLNPGIITTFEGTTPKKRIFVAGGFAEVNERGCIVLAEAAEPLEEIDRASAERALADARDDLADTKDAGETERQRLETAVKVAETRLEVLDNPSH
ncbi:ATP synthase F1 subcomplex epsilon subunit [Arboricoccus pini]|uniref:ATP synthase epsilon chain n=1 Tax=Arboricoccus pini TaxID=1963835 RepID=A0A212QPN6_9PROT|nr:ATP synthase F1 subunit epsilon [Arboricoccus pini]SNB61231.1 ATP synthase F1 subcomplex epsilon subunit [Arboricoccus pini]